MYHSIDFKHNNTFKHLTCGQTCDVMLKLLMSQCYVTVTPVGQSAVLLFTHETMLSECWSCFSPAGWKVITWLILCLCVSLSEGAEPSQKRQFVSTHHPLCLLSNQSLVLFVVVWKSPYSFDWSEPHTDTYTMRWCKAWSPTTSRHLIFVSEVLLRLSAHVTRVSSCVYVSVCFVIMPLLLLP